MACHPTPRSFALAHDVVSIRVEPVLAPLDRRLMSMIEQASTRGGRIRDPAGFPPCRPLVVAEDAELSFGRLAIAGDGRVTLPWSEPTVSRSRRWTIWRIDHVSPRE